jgi:protein involved in sex pheromone biosynthesis
MTIQVRGTEQRKRTPAQLAMAAAGVLVLLSACSPTVKVEAPDKPIVINLNVKIEQEVRIRVEKEVEELFSANPDIF